MSRPLLIRKDTKNDEKRWAYEVKQRDSWRCRIQRKMFGKWVTCMRPATDAAHVFKRADCGQLRFADRCLGVAGCRGCHDALHAHTTDARVHPHRYKVASGYLREQHALGNLKVLPKGVACA